jgi:type II secretory pathway pseudopilin PulG
MLRNPAKAAQFIRQKRRAKEGGYFLLELALALAISTVLLASQFSQIVDGVNQTNAAMTGQYATTVRDAVNQYENDNDTNLKSGNAVPGFAVPLQPTIQELLTAHYLPAGFGVTSPLQLTFKNVLKLSGTCPSGPDCIVSGLSYSTNAYVDVGGQVRSDVLIAAVSKIGQDGSMSYAETPGLLTSIGGGTVPNPAGSVAGVLAIRIGYGSGTLNSMNAYYKRDGSLPLTGDMNANGKNIASVANLTATGTTTTGSLVVGSTISMTGPGGAPGTACGANPTIERNASGTGMVICSGGTWQLIGNATAGIGDGNPCSAAGQLGTDPTGIGFVCNGTYWTALNTTANAGAACTPAGRTASAINNRETLVCKNGVYVRLANLFDKNVEVSRQLVTDGLTVNKPACDSGGTAAYSFLLTQTVIDVSVTPPRQAMYIAATDNGPSWTVKIRVKDNSGGDFSASSYAVSEVMKLECSY